MVPPSASMTPTLGSWRIIPLSRWLIYPWWSLLSPKDRVDLVMAEVTPLTNQLTVMILPVGPLFFWCLAEVVFSFPPQKSQSNFSSKEEFSLKVSSKAQGYVECCGDGAGQISQDDLRVKSPQKVANRKGNPLISWKSWWNIAIWPERMFPGSRLDVHWLPSVKLTATSHMKMAETIRAPFGSPA